MEVKKNIFEILVKKCLWERKFFKLKTIISNFILSLASVVGGC